MKRKTQYGGSLRRAVVALLAVVMLFSVCFPALRASADTETTESTETTVETTESTETTEVTEETTAPTETTASTVTVKAAANEADGTNTVTFTMSLDGVEAGYIHYTGDDSDTGDYTITPISGSSVTISYDSSKTNYVVFFLKPSTGYLLTGLDSSGNGDRYSISASSYGNIENYPYIHKIADYAATEEGGGYIALLGFINWNNGAYSDQTVSATGVQPSLTVTAVCDETENIAIGTELTFTVTITPSTYSGYNTGNPENVIIKINDIEVEEKNITVNNDGTYTVKHTVTEEDVDGIILSASAQVTYSSEITLSDGQTAATEVTLTASGTTTVTITTYTVTYTDGVEGEEVFTDQVYKAISGAATPAFDGDDDPDTDDEPTRDGYTFAGWEPEVAETVTADVTYVAQWTATSTIDPEEISPIVPVDYGYSKSKEATNLDTNYESQVTLSLPSAQQELSTDVVFVLDKSTSTDVESRVMELVTELYNQVKGTDASVNVGVVIFNKVANRVLELTELTADSLSKVQSAVETTISGGTNMHAGLLAGKAMLDEDDSVSASRKYLILVSDGLSYYYCQNDDYTTAYTIASLNGGDDGNGNRNCTVNVGLDCWDIKYGSLNYTPTNWETYLGTAKALLNTDYSQYVYEVDSSSIPTEKDSTGAIQYKDRESYPINADLSLYYSYELFRELSSTYNCYAVNNGNATYAWGSSFMNYLGGSDVSFADIQKDIVYLLDAGTTVVDVIGDSVDANGIAYDFDFVNEASALSLTVNNEEYTVTALGNNQYGFGDANGSSDGTTYPFVLTYYPETADTEEYFVWEINVPITNFMQVQLTYTVVLTNPQTTAGEYGEYDQYGSDTDGTTDFGLYTNNSAILYPVDSNGNKGDPDPFQMPTVSYTVEETTEPTETDPTDPTTTDPTTETEEEVTYFDLTVKKVWKDNHNSGSTRPSSVTVRIYCDGVKYEDVELSSDNSWKVTLDDLEEDHVWSYVELNVPSGYKASISLSGNTLTVTNTLKTTYTSSDTLLQTGQLNWPIPVLMLLGLATMGAGCSMIIVKKKGRYES